MTDVIEEEPYVAVVSDGFFQTVCSACLLDISALNHSCAPDLQWRHINSTLILRSQKEGQTYNDEVSTLKSFKRNVFLQLTVSYTPYLLTTGERRKILKESYFFHCVCKRCADKEEDGYYRSINRSSCDDGICPVNDDSTTLIGANCRVVSNITRNEAIRMNDEIGPDTEFGENDLMDLYESKSKFLSSRNTRLAGLANRQVASLPLGTKELTVILSNLFFVALETDPSSVKTQRLRDKLRLAVSASHGPEEMVRSRGDQYASIVYNMINCKQH